MEIKEMTIEELETRKAAIAEEVDVPEADLDALGEELRSINEELETRKAAEAKKAELRAAVAAGSGDVIKTFEKKEESKKMTLEEIRSSHEYVEAYKNYIITEDARECRALLTEIAAPGGGVPVPSLVDSIVRTAWEKDEIISRARKTYVKGIYRVPFEFSADPADFHEEGDVANDEERLVIGITQMIPGNIKKWITISDEAIAIGMGGEDFLRYIYDELTHQIVKFLADYAVSRIVQIPNEVTGTTPEITAPIIAAATPALATIPTAFSYLSDEAANPVVLMNKLTYAKFVEAQALANFSFDPFMGLPVLFTSAIPAYDTAQGPAPYAIVGDLSGLQINFPEGDDVLIKYDDVSLAEQDLVKVIGRIYAAVAVTAPGRFVRISKETPGGTH